MINKTAIFFTCILFLTINCNFLKAQVVTKDYFVNTFFEIGYLRYISSLNSEDVNKNGYSGTLRVMWQPEYLLSIGIETGYAHFYSSESTIPTENGNSSTLTASLSGIPIVSVFGMKINDRFNIAAGFGSVILLSNSESFGNSVKSVIYSGGFLAAVNYIVPLNDDFKLGAETKWLYINKVESYTLSINLVLFYSLIKY